MIIPIEYLENIRQSLLELKKILKELRESL